MKPNLNALKRFVDKEVKLVKLDKKRDNSMVPTGHYEVGTFDFHEYPETDKFPEQTGALVSGSGFRFLRTSPIVKVVDETQNSAIFETEGGFYKVELHEELP